MRKGLSVRNDRCAKDKNTVKTRHGGTEYEMDTTGLRGRQPLKRVMPPVVS